MATNGRLRDYLTKNEVRALLRAAKQSKRYAARNHAMILLAFRHGFRASELVELRIGDGSDDAGDRIRVAYSHQQWLGLTALKAKYDPANFFRMNANIPPS